MKMTAKCYACGAVEVLCPEAPRRSPRCPDCGAAWPPAEDARPCSRCGAWVPRDLGAPVCEPCEEADEREGRP